MDANGGEVVSVRRLLAAHLATPSSGFSIGAYGAIAEFLRDPEEALVYHDPQALTVVTARGGLSVCLERDPQILAYETLSKRPHGWHQAVAFCLPAARSAMSRRVVVTELGPDTLALRAADRRAILFDLGVGGKTSDFCVRTEEPEMLRLLRQACGRPLFAADNPVLPALKRAAPHRVVISGLGRIEVFQAIGMERTPDGPHTHLLPELIDSRRSEPSGSPIPENLLPALMLYPGHPLYDQLGKAIAFSPDRHTAFQALVGSLGAPEHVAEKRRAMTAYRDGCAFEDYEPPRTRLGRTALRIALRQLYWTDGESGRLARWRNAFDRSDPSLDRTGSSS